MKVIYVPKRDKDYNPIAGVDTGFSYLIPDTEREKYLFAIFVHGVGEQSGGTLENLQNLVLGQKQPDGSRLWPFVTEDMKRAVDLFGMIIAIPTYETNTFFEPSKVNWVYDYIKARYSIYDRMMLPGFSLGGGAVFKYITSSLANANRVALAVPVAAVTSIISNNKAIPGQAGVVTHAFSCDDDPRVSPSNTLNQITAINSTNPSIKALYTFFRKRDHSIEGAWSLIPPKAPGGTGFIDAAETIYQLFTDIVKSGVPRQMKSGVVIPIPQPIPNPTPDPVVLKAEFNLSDNQIISSPVFELDASASMGVKSGWDAYKWDIKVLKTSSNESYAVRTESGAYVSNPRTRLIDIVDGEYEITLTVEDISGSVASKSVKIVVSLSGKIPIGFNSTTDLVSYSDGSTESAEAVFESGKWTVKTADGTIITL